MRRSLQRRFWAETGRDEEEMRLREAREMLYNRTIQVVTIHVSRKNMSGKGWMENEC